MEIFHAFYVSLSMLGSSHLMNVQVKGVVESFKKHESDEVDSKGIKAYFMLDETGILSLEKVIALQINCSKLQNRVNFKPLITCIGKVIVYSDRISL